MNLSLSSDDETKLNIGASLPLFSLSPKAVGIKSFWFLIKPDIALLADLNDVACLGCSGVWSPNENRIRSFDKPLK